MKKENITLIAVGDVIIARDDPTSIFKNVVKILRSGDITFATCDQTYSTKGYPYISPNHILLPQPNNTDALIYAGLNVVSLANNHSMDFGPEGLLDSMDIIKKAGIEVVGAGENIIEARKPVILEKKGNRIGFLAYCCVGPERAQATKDVPGHAPVRVWTIYKQVDYQPGTAPEIVTMAYREDLASMSQDIQELKSKVDILIVSFHWGIHFIPAQIPMYEFEIGHAAVDAGADIILGSHAHILKGIEVYKGKAIFHGLNNFACETKGKLFSRTRRAPVSLPEASNTMIAKAVIEDGEIKRVSYIPCHINEESEPEVMISHDQKGKEIFKYVENITRSQNLNTNFNWDGDEIVIGI